MRWLILFVLLTVVGCEDRFRYPCQDPVNWEKAQCKPPVCSADGTCTKDLIIVETK